MLVCVLAVVLFGFGGLYWLGSQIADEVTVDWDVPAALDLNEPFELDIAITNVSNSPVDLASMDINKEYLQGMLIQTTTPLYVNTYEYSPLGGGELFQTYSFNTSIAPGETLTVTFRGQAVLRGDYPGTMIICINSSFNCKTISVRTIIN